MSIPFRQYKLRNACEHAYGYANSYNRKPHEDPNYVDGNASNFIRTFSDQTHKNYLLARHLKAASNGQWKTLQWLMQGDLDAVLDKRMAKKTPGIGAKTAKAGVGSQEKVNKAIYVPLTNNFGPERLEQFVSQKQKFQHVLDFPRGRMTDEKLDDPNRKRFEKNIADVTVKRGLGRTGLPRIDEDLERTGRKKFGLELGRTGRMRSMTQLAEQPRAGYLTGLQRAVGKNQMKNFIKTMNQFYANVTEAKPINIDSVEELTQTLEDEFYRTISYNKPLSFSIMDEPKLRLSAVIRMLKSMPGYEAFERVLYHEPFDRNKPWTWLRAFPKRIPKEYLKRISENILNDMEKWKRQQKITALAYSPRKQAIGVIKDIRLQKKRGRRNLKNETQKKA